MTMQQWTPNSWRNKPCQQQVIYPSQTCVDKAIAELSQLPPLVTVDEVKNLQQQLALASTGKHFLLQGGDCAESFSACAAESITNKIRILLQMSLVLIHGLQKPVIRVGRFAGQYAKPRSVNTETKNGMTLPAYRGDLINAIEFHKNARTPDPQRMLNGYQHAALTLNYIRTLSSDGFASLAHPEYWQLDFAQDSTFAKQFQRIAGSMQQALDFVKVLGNMPEKLERVDFFTSHEALHLPYEQALTKQQAGKWYNLGTHFPWVGMRTSKLAEAHIEYIRGIANPIAVKIGPQINPAWIGDLVERLNPHNEPGRLTFIHRLGAKQIADVLPNQIEAVQATGKSVLWCVDPMHGNTTKTDNGYKTRYFDDILSELKQAFQIHRECGSYLGGVHFELTGENVTEVIGGAGGITELDLTQAYESLVDPRLNYQQALEMAMLIADSNFF